MDSSYNSRVDKIPSRPGADEIEVADYVWALWRHRAVIALTTLTCAAIALALALTSSKVYQATAVVTAAPPGGGELPYAVIVQVRNLLQSAPVVESAFEKYPEATAGLTPGTFISRNLSIERNRDTNLWMVSVRLPDPVAAAGTANLLSEEGVAAYARTAAEQQAAVKPAATLAKVDPRLLKRVEEWRGRVDETRAALLRFRDNARLEERRASRDAAARLPFDIASLDTDIASERAAVALVESELKNQPEFLANTGNDADIPPGTPPALRRILNPLYGTLSARAAEGRARIAFLEQRRKLLVGRTADAARDGAGVPALELDLAGLQTQYQRALDRLAAVESELEVARENIASALPPADPPPVVLVSLTERAIAPASPIAPRPVRSLLLGLALGVFVGVLAALVLDAVQVQRGQVVEHLGAV